MKGQSLYTNYFTHRREFSEYLSYAPNSEHNLKINQYWLHDWLFPDAKDGDYHIDEQGLSSMLTSLSSLDKKLANHRAKPANSDRRGLIKNIGKINQSLMNMGFDNGTLSLPEPSKGGSPYIASRYDFDGDLTIDENDDIYDFLVYVKLFASPNDGNH